MFQSFVSWVKAVASTLFTDIQQAVVAAEPAAVAIFDGLIQKYTPHAIAAVQAAATNPDLLSGSEKRSAVVASLTQSLEADGHDIAAEGFTAFINLLIEVGVNFLKLIEGKALTPPPAA